MDRLKKLERELDAAQHKHDLAVVRVCKTAANLQRAGEAWAKASK